MDGTHLLIYIYIHVYILPFFHQNKMITSLSSLLQCIGQKICTNFIQIVIFLYIILLSFILFYVSLSIFQLFILLLF